MILQISFATVKAFLTFDVDLLIMFKFDLSFLCIMLHPCPGFLKNIFLKLQKAIDSFEKRVKIMKKRNRSSCLPKRRDFKTDDTDDQTDSGFGPG